MTVVERKYKATENGNTSEMYLSSFHHWLLKCWHKELHFYCKWIQTPNITLQSPWMLIIEICTSPEKVMSVNPYCKWFKCEIKQKFHSTNRDEDKMSLQIFVHHHSAPLLYCPFMLAGLTDTCEWITHAFGGCRERGVPKIASVSVSPPEPASPS